jgi:hypothetical protein
MFENESGEEIQTTSSSGAARVGRADVWGVGGSHGISLPDIHLTAAGAVATSSCIRL